MRPTTVSRLSSLQSASAHTARRELQRALVHAASVRYRSAGYFAYYFARGKLGLDPLFIDLLQLGVLPPQAWILDLGCGQAVLAAWLLAARERFEAGQWPVDWPPPPHVCRLHGLELMPSDVTRAASAFAGESCVQVEQADICTHAFESVNVVTLFDVLHYLDPEHQAGVLRRIRAALGPGGLLLARVGDESGGLRFDLSRWVDQVVAFVRGRGILPICCRPATAWAEALHAMGFQVRMVPTEGGPPFANTVLIARVPEASPIEPDA
jgi:SAM-dependent methyltransferase